MILCNHTRDYLLAPPLPGVALSNHAYGSCVIMGAKPEGSLGAQFMEINIEQGYKVRGTASRDRELIADKGKMTEVIMC